MLQSTSVAEQLPIGDRLTHHWETVEYLDIMDVYWRLLLTDKGRGL